MTQRSERRPRPTAPARSTPPVEPVPDRFFRQLVASMRNGVLVITRDTTVVSINEAAYRILELEPSPANIGRLVGEVLESQPEVVKILCGAFDGHLPNRAELRLSPSGTVIGYTLSLVLDERGEAAGAALIFKDLTLVEQMEERERLRDRLAALGEMAATIAHEVKNPLAGIEVMAGLLRRRLPDTPDAQALLNDIIAEAKKANAIVLEVLEFVRPIRLQVEQTSIAQVLHDAVTMAERKVERGGVSVTLNVEEQLPLIQADHGRLCQLFGNLMINALEALGGKGTISIVAGKGVGYVEPGASGSSPATVVVEIGDSGPGVPKEIAERIFNPFFTTKPQGTGLGLAVVRKIVDAHNGHIDLVTDPDAGTRFRVTLPLASGEEWLR